jgi:retron-type reverse transcriptase
MNNYRPISLLPAISKILERIIHDQLFNYFTLNKLLYEGQYGFNKGHSTELATMEIIDRIISNLNIGKTPINIFMDLSKAFDTIDHSILLDKLYHYGIRNTALDLFKSYLSNRKQYTDIDGTKSTLNTITTGVPQGSILGPLLFIIYMNDITYSSDRFKFILYADDTTLSASVEDFEQGPNVNINRKINVELQLVSDWLKVNKLSLNTKKTKYMLFHMPQKRIPELNLDIDATSIDCVDNFNLLGIVTEHVIIDITVLLLQELQLQAAFASCHTC